MSAKSPHINFYILVGFYNYDDAEDGTGTPLTSSVRRTLSATNFSEADKLVGSARNKSFL